MEVLLAFLICINVLAIHVFILRAAIDKDRPSDVIGCPENFYMLLLTMCILPAFLVVQPIYLVGLFIAKLLKNPAKFIHNLMMKNPADLIKFRIILEKK